MLYFNNQTRRNNMKDIDLHNRFGIPISTLYVWKNKEKTNWRYKLYWFMIEKLAKEEGGAK